MFSRFIGAMLLALALPLGGCVTTSVVSTGAQLLGAEVTQQQAGAALASFTLVDRLAISYLSNPPCQLGQTFSKNGCREAVTAANLNAILDKGEPAAQSIRDTIKSASAAGSNIGIARATYDAVVKATSDAKVANPMKSSPTALGLAKI